MVLRRQFNQRQVEESSDYAPTGTTLIVDTDPVSGDLGIATLTADAASRSIAVPAGAAAKPIKPPKPPKPTNPHNNDAPTAINDTAATNEDSPISGNLLANDTDPDKNAMTVASFKQPDHGSVTVAPDGSFTYTPAANYNGADSFTYQPPTALAASNFATVSITVKAVNDAPTANTDSYDLKEDTTLTVAAATGVLGNDTDIDANPLTAALVSGPAHGTSFTLNPDGSFTYTPAANYNGPDSFTYTANDGTAQHQHRPP